MNENEHTEEIIEDAPELIEARALADAGDTLTAEQFDLLQDAGEEPSSYVGCTDTDDYRHEDDAVWCDGCQEFHSHNADMETVYTSTNGTWRLSEWSTGEWCEAARDSRAFRCDRSGDWYQDRSAGFGRGGFYPAEVDGETVCYERFEDDLHCWDSDGEYHWSPEPEDGIASYHDSDRDFGVADDGGVTASIGVELETYCPQPADAAAARPGGMIAERDGSLDDYHGVEFVGPPLTFDDYVKDTFGWRRFLGTLRDQDATAYKTPDGGSYGMHVSVGRQNMDRGHQARFVLLINANEEMSVAVAHRNSAQWAEYAHKTREHAEHAAQYGTGKYSATHVDSRRIEVRIFRGNVSDAGFMRNIEYVQAVWEFTKTASVTACMTDAAFLRWVHARSERFPNLTAELTRKGFTKRAAPRDARGRFVSTREPAPEQVATPAPEPTPAPAESVISWTRDSHTGTWSSRPVNPRVAEVCARYARNGEYRSLTAERRNQLAESWSRLHGGAPGLWLAIMTEGEIPAEPPRESRFTFDFLREYSRAITDELTANLSFDNFIDSYRVGVDHAAEDENAEVAIRRAA